MSEVHFEGKIAQKAVIVNNGKVLVVRDPRMLYEVWELPGGRMNEGEHPQTALARELHEELGCDFDIHEIVHMEQFKHNSEQINAFLIVYRATMRDSESSLVPDEREISHMQWLGREEITRCELFPEHKRAIENYYEHESIPR